MKKLTSCGLSQMFLNNFPLSFFTLKIFSKARTKKRFFKYLLSRSITYHSRYMRNNHKSNAFESIFRRWKSNFFLFRARNFNQFSAFENSCVPSDFLLLNHCKINLFIFRSAFDFLIAFCKISSPFEQTNLRELMRGVKWFIFSRTFSYASQSSSGSSFLAFLEKKCEKQLCWQRSTWDNNVRCQCLKTVVCERDKTNFN